MAIDRSEPPQTPVDPPPPPSAGPHWLTWVVIGAAVLVIVAGYVLVAHGS